MGSAARRSSRSLGIGVSCVVEAPAIVVLAARTHTEVFPDLEALWQIGSKVVCSL